MLPVRLRYVPKTTNESHDLRLRKNRKFLKKQFRLGVLSFRLSLQLKEKKDLGLHLYYLRPSIL